MKKKAFAKLIISRNRYRIIFIISNMKIKLIKKIKMKTLI